MLSHKDLKILRAALTFFADEMLPHGAGAMQPYFDAPIEREPTASDIADLQSLLESCRLRFICTDSDMCRSLDNALYTSLTEAEELADRLNANVAAVILSTTDA